MEEKLWQTYNIKKHIKKQRHHFADKGLHIVEIVLFLVAMYRCEELNHKEGWARKNWCFWIVMLETILESPLDSKEINPVNPKGNQQWIFIGRTDTEAVDSILWPPDMKGQLIGKDPDSGKDQRQKEKRVAEDEMVR